MNKEKGFTLIEILISIGIFSFIATLGLFISMDFFRSFSFHSEESSIVSLLQNARSQSMDNIDQVRHGVHFMSGQYIIFECPSVTPQCTSWTSSSSDLVIKQSYNSSISSPTLPFDVIFNQLRGDSTATTITINDQGKTKNITINTEGQIDWQ